MKKFLNLLLATPVAAVIMVACQSDEGITYSGPEYVMFSDTVYTMPVQDKEETFSVPVAATTTADYDRNYAVEMSMKNQLLFVDSISISLIILII